MDILINKNYSPSDDSISGAISILCSPVLGSLSLCNALAGYQDDKWFLVNNFTLDQLIEEAVTRNIDICSLRATCCDLYVIDTPPFRGSIKFDARRRCNLCNKIHFIDPRRDEPLSCGRNAKMFNPPEWRWTRYSAEKAVEGTYVPV